MVYTVKQLARLANISARTLHYYDEIGLLKPSFVKENGYRYYEEKALMKLQQVLFFRELEFPLDAIIRMVNAPDFNTLEALDDQKKLLEIKKARIDRLLDTIDKTITNLRGDETMKPNDLFASFTDEQAKQYEEEVKAKWGHTEAYKESVARTKQWTKEDFDRIKGEGQRITDALANLMDKGVEDAEVQKLIEQHHQHINQFYDCSYELYRQLGIMYVEDTRFADNYNRVQPHLAKFMRDAIAYHCNKHEK